MLIALVIKSTGLLLAAFAIQFLLRRSSAAYRLLLWNIAIGCLLGLPMLMLWMPSWPVLPVAPPIASAPEPVTPTLPVPFVTAETQAGMPVLLTIWLIGMAVVLARLLIGMVRVHRLGKLASSVAQPGLPGHVTLLVSDANLAPLAWGFLHPKILLPRAAESWPSERLRIVLAHELIHIRRLDYLSQIAGRLTYALYWFNPLAWFAAGQLARERELSCDDEVLNMGTDRTDYAEQLLAILRTLRDPSSLHAPVTGMAHAFEGRLAGILDPDRPRVRPRRATAIAIALAAACFLLPFAATLAPAQESSSRFTGVVRDPSGAVIPHVTVTLTDPRDHKVQAATTGPVGEFSFDGLPAGSYRLEASVPGFAPQSSIVTAPASAQTITLSVGSLKETVEVIGRSPVRPPADGTPHRIRVGGNVQASRLISKVQPVYPAVAEAAGIEGTVVLHAIIGVDGRLLSLGVANQHTNADLSSAAMDAVRQWTYQPTLLNGEPVEVVTTIAVVFRLQL